jgi:2,3-bisphosphoglycerate-dependent phosphoglycerate mutase
MQLYFIRHAQSENNALWSQTGNSKGRSEDPGLTELGRRQAQLLAAYLGKGDPHGGCNPNEINPRGFQFTHLYTSYMLRSVQTGTILARQLGLPLHGWEILHEHGGIYLEDEETGETEGLPGKDQAFFQTHYPDLILPGDFKYQGWWDRRPVETLDQCLERADHFLQALLAKHGKSDDRVAIISHGGFYNCFLQSVIGFSKDQSVWFTIYNTAITRINFLPDGTELVYQNRMDHLPPEMIT